MRQNNCLAGPPKMLLKTGLPTTQFQEVFLQKFFVALAVMCQKEHFLSWVTAIDGVWQPQAGNLNKIELVIIPF